MEGDWVDVAPVSELPPGSRKVVEVDDLLALVLNVDGDFHAVENRCSHDNVPLATGDLVDSELICPRHGAHFCLRTGAALTPPAYEPVLVIPTRIVNGVLQIRDPRWD